MKRAPFQMVPHKQAVLLRDGKFHVAGRASFVWERFLLSRASGVPGLYEIRYAAGGRQHHPWHRLEWTVEQAEADLREWDRRPTAAVRRARTTRRAREERGLEVG